MTASSSPAAVCLAVLVLAGCSGGDNEPRSERETGSAPEQSAQTEQARESDSESTTAGAEFECEQEVCLNRDAQYADFDPERELTLVEQALMREPGPYAGDDFDAGAVFEAAKESEPDSPREWSEAILAQMHPDYVQAAQDVITFNPSIEGVPEQPSEEYRDVEVVGANHFAIVLDASGSMDQDAGDGSRMRAAKTAIQDFVGQLPEGSTVSLRVYGQEGDNTDAEKKVSCASTSVVYEGDQNDLGGSVDDIQPVGWTPLALAIEEAAGDIPEDASDAIVYVVTDGIETCGGDPVAATQALSAEGIEPVVNVIGFEVGDADTQQLRDMAAAGGGTYADVSSQADLEQYWREDMQAMMSAWSDWKRDALQTINEQGRANMEQANESGQAVMDAATQEFDDAKRAIALMQRDESIDYDTHTAVWSEFYGRHNAIWGWGYESKNANWTEAYDQKNLSWTNAYDLGNDQWSQYYARKNAGR